MSLLSLPAGDPGVVSLVARTDDVDASGSVNIVVRNNTSSAVGDISLTGSARDSAGALVGSGSSQGFNPKVVAPGEVAFGYVYFNRDLPKRLSFEFTVETEPVGTYLAPMTITEVNNTGEQIVGAIKNDGDSNVTGPISADIMCFGSDGKILDFVSGFAEQDALAPGATGTFSTDLYGDGCPIGLVASSGFGRL